MSSLPASMKKIHNNCGLLHNNSLLELIYFLNNVEHNIIKGIIFVRLFTMYVHYVHITIKSKLHKEQSLVMRNYSNLDKRATFFSSKTGR